MLEYTKTILQKVSFNHDLFRKELAKSLKWLNQRERLTLKLWIESRFGRAYNDAFEGRDARRVA